MRREDCLDCLILDYNQKWIRYLVANVVEMDLKNETMKRFSFDYEITGW